MGKQKMTARQLQMLSEMGAIRPDEGWLVSGHNAQACEALVRRGLAKRIGSDGALGRAYKITPAGRTALSESEAGK